MALPLVPCWTGLWLSINFILRTGGSRISCRGRGTFFGGRGPPTRVLFGENGCETERIWSRSGGVRWEILYVDLPMEDDVLSGCWLNVAATRSCLPVFSHMEPWKNIRWFPRWMKHLNNDCHPLCFVDHSLRMTQTCGCWVWLVWCHSDEVMVRAVYDGTCDDVMWPSVSGRETVQNWGYKCSFLLRHLLTRLFA